MAHFKCFICTEDLPLDGSDVVVAICNMFMGSNGVVDVDVVSNDDDVNLD